MSNRPRPSGPANRPPTRRQIVAQQREANVQRRAVLAISGAVALAVLLLIAGFVYERFYQPSVKLAQVNDATLTRGQYEQLLRGQTVQQMAQTLQLSKLFGANQSFGQSGRFDEQVVQANSQLATLGTRRDRSTPVDQSIVSQWIDQQVTEQNAKTQFQIEPAQGEVDQALVAELGSLLQTPTMSSTDTLSETATTEAATEAGTEATTSATSAAATAAASAAPTATSVPTATPEAGEATELANQIVDELYTEYTNILDALPQEALPAQRTPHVTKDEMSQVLRTNYRQQLLRARVGEALVKDASAAGDSAPTEITVRHILLQVPKPAPSPTPGPADATATAEEEATATAEPTPTPKPSVEEVEQQFVERKTEADKIYQELTANPATFADVARATSEDPGSKDQGGELPPFNREGITSGGQGQGLVKEFVDAAWALKDNEISQPVRTQFGWHIIQRLPEDPKTKLDRLRQEAFTSWLAEKRQQATITPPLTPTPTEVPLVTTDVPTGETALPEATTTP